MEELALTFEEFDRRMCQEANGAVQSFVAMGYLLRKAKEENTLHNSRFANIYEYAKARLNIDRSQVSRLIRINERYSEGGYSEHLQERYQAYGQSKLSEMLALPDAVAEVIPADATREEIRRIGAEIAEEEQISDIEVALEEKKEESLILQAFHAYFHQNHEEYITVHESLKTGDLAAVMDVVAPSGIAMKMVRVSGVGKLMISIRGRNIPVDLVNTRTGEKLTMPWDEVVQEFTPLFSLDLPPMTSWEQVYQQEFPEVAPAQPKKTLEVVKSEAPARPSPKKAPEKPSGKHRKEQKGEAVPQPAKSSKAGQELMEKTVITGKTAAFIPVPQEAGTEEAGPTEVQPISLKESYIREVDRISERYDACRKARSWDMCIRHLRRLEEVIMQIRNYCEPDSAQMSIEDLPGVMPKGGADE